jgi:hypothetical protein
MYEPETNALNHELEQSREFRVTRMRNQCYVAVRGTGLNQAATVLRKVLGCLVACIQDRDRVGVDAKRCWQYLPGVLIYDCNLRVQTGIVGCSGGRVAGAAMGRAASVMSVPRP